MSVFNKEFLEFATQRLDVFIETGTNEGISLEEARHYHFRELHSIDIDDKFYSKACVKFKDPRLTLHLGDSPKVLSGILNNSWDEYIVFWLDAHYSGGGNRTDTKECPLMDELKVITKYDLKWRPLIIIDDCFMFQDEYWKSGTTRQEFDRKQWPTMKEIELALHGFKFEIRGERLYCF